MAKADIVVKLPRKRSPLVGAERIEGDHILIGTDAAAGRFAELDEEVSRRRPD